MTLWKNDKIPYGTWVAHDNLPRIFQDAYVFSSRLSPDFQKASATDEDLTDLYDYYAGVGIRVVLTPRFQPGMSEWNALLEEVNSGKEVFISSFSFGDNVLESLGLSVISSDWYLAQDSLEVSVRLFDTTFEQYAYPGANGGAYVSKMDSSFTTVLGYDEEQRPNYVKVSSTSGGGIYIHLAPLALSNFFLLHKNNIAYYEQVFSYLAPDAEFIIWDDYFRNHSKGAVNDFSALQVILAHDSLRWAFWIVIAIFALVYFFNSKRKQAIIPVQPKLKNSTLDFVKTIGRLYFEHKDNVNLAHKMIAHFLEIVRVKYNISTTVLDNEFRKKLIQKSGKSEKEVENLLHIISDVQQAKSLSDDSLMNLSAILENFKTTM